MSTIGFINRFDCNKVPESVRKFAYENAKHDYYDGYLYLNSNYVTPEGIQEMKETSNGFKHYIQSKYTTDEDLTNALDINGDLTNRYYASMSPNLKPHHLDQMIESSEYELILSAAKYPNLNGSQIDKILRSKYSSIKDHVAMHPNMSKDTMTKIFSDPNSDYYLKLMAEKNPKYKEYYPEGYK